MRAVLWHCDPSVLTIHTPAAALWQTKQPSLFLCIQKPMELCRKLILSLGTVQWRLPVRASGWEWTICSRLLPLATASAQAHHPTSSRLFVNVNLCQWSQRRHLSWSWAQCTDPVAENEQETPLLTSPWVHSEPCVGVIPIDCNSSISSALTQAPRASEMNHILKQPLSVPSLGIPDRDWLALTQAKALQMSMLRHLASLLWASCQWEADLCSLPSLQHF